MRTTPIRVELRDGKLPPGFIDSNEAARRLRLSPSSLRVYRSKRLGPPYTVWNGWRSIYRETDVASYAAKQAEQLQREAEERLQSAGVAS